MTDLRARLAGSWRLVSWDWRDAKGGYFGTYRVDESAGTITHHIEGSWFPNLVGTEQVRQYSLDGSRLSLHAETPWGRVTIVWKKVGASSR